MASNFQLLFGGGPTVNGQDQRHYATGIKINLANNLRGLCNLLEEEGKEGGTGSRREGVSFLQLLIR